MSELAIGIDLGTTNCCAAVFRDGKVTVIPSNNGNTLPSYVKFEDGQRIVGQEAKDGAYEHPENTIFAIKRIIGRKFNENEVQQNKVIWPFDVVNINGLPAISIKENGMRKIVAPEEVSSEVLKHIKETAEQFLGKTVKKAVITVPANFCDSQKKATKAAGEMAGLEVIGIISEPTAAAVAYGLQNRIDSNESTILVFDFGGGTLDISVIRAIDNTSFKVISTAGDMHFGGEDFDKRLLDKLVREFEDTHNTTGLKNDKSALSRLRNEVELAKQKLSGALKAKVSVQYLYDKKAFQTTVTREDFETCCANLFPRVLGPVEEALAGAKMSKKDIKQVVLVGGSSRIPKVVSILQSYFTGQQFCRDISADEAVAMGAAILARSLVDNLFGISLVEVIPRSLGVGLINDKLLIVLPKNTPIPVRRQKSTVTTEDNQEKSRFDVYEGENEDKASANRLWDTLILTHKELGKAGSVENTVTFEYDKFGMLRVSVAETRNPEFTTSKDIRLK